VVRLRFEMDFKLAEVIREYEYIYC
jgi:hypothetical protein